MRVLFIAPILSLCLCSGCNMQQLIDGSTCSIQRNTMAAQQTTEVIEENAALIDESNRVLEENKALMQQMMM